MDKRIVVTQEPYGAIAPGMMKKVIVTIRCLPEGGSKVKDEIQIVTKSDIFKIPVEGTILTEEQYDQEM